MALSLEWVSLCSSAFFLLGPTKDKKFFNYICVSNHTWIFFIRLFRIIPHQLLHSLLIHFIYFNKPYRLFPQIMKEWFSILATRLEPNNDLLKTMPGRKLTSFSPRFYELPTRFPENKSFSFFPFISPEVPNMEPFPSFHTRNHLPIFDSYSSLELYSSHGYILLFVFANQLSTDFN